MTGVRAGVALEPAPRRRRHWRLVAAVVAVLGLLAGCSDRTTASATASAATRLAASAATGPTSAAGLPRLGPAMAVEVNDPALNDIGDPYVLPVPAGVGGLTAPGYAVFWTTDWSANVPVAVSSDLIHWRRTPDALPTLPSWAKVVSPPAFWSPVPAGVSTMTWGPTVRRIGAEWVLYFSTEDARSGGECIGAAVADNPLGPFVDRAAQPLVCQATLGGSIDPSVVATGPGHLALVWKNDGNSIGVPDAIWEQALDSAGTALTGKASRLLGSDQAWEHGIIEGPAMLADSRGGWWLFYSGGSWQSNTYDTGVAWCETVAGPCREPSATPLLASTPTAVSPGGLDTFVDHQGHLWASYSAFPSAPADARAAVASPRVLELSRVLSH